MKKCSRCDDGGFIALQTKLFSGEQPKCLACLELLSLCKFQPAALGETHPRQRSRVCPYHIDHGAECWT